MDNIDYEAEYARLRREIENLPEDQRESLRALHAESVERHREIRVTRGENERALAELRSKLTEMAQGFRALDEALGDLRLATKLALFELEVRRRERRGEA